MTVYLLEAGCMDDEHCVGVYSTHEKAQERIEREPNGFYKNTMYISPVVIDEDIC